MKSMIFSAAAFAAALASFCAQAQEAPVRAQASSPEIAKLADKDSSARKVGSRERERVASAGYTNPVSLTNFERGRFQQAVMKPVDEKAARTGAGTKKNRKSAKGNRVSKGKYGSIISRYASAYGVPVSLAHAVIRVESNYRANARGRAGEIGLMQIKPATARMMGYRGGAKGLYNPDTNIKYGMLYLAKAHKLGGGSVCSTILKYNAGHGAKRMNPVSARYCGKVKRHMRSI